MGIRKDRFGKTIDGNTVDLYTLTNTQGMEALITNFGAKMHCADYRDRSLSSMDSVSDLSVTQSIFLA